MVGDDLLAIVADMIFVCVLVVGDRLSAEVADMILIRVLMVGDDLSAVITNMIFVYVLVVGDYLSAVVADMILIRVLMVGDDLSAVITNMIFVCVLVVGDYLSAVVANMIFVRVFVIRNHFAANIADMVFVRILVQARISALAAHAVRPFMGFARHDNGAAAAPFLLVNVSGSYCPLLRAAHMVGRILFSIGLMAVLAYCLGGAGSRTAGVRTVSVLFGIIILHIAVGIQALMPMMRRIVLPRLIPAVTVRLNRLVFCRAAFVTGIYSFALRQAGRRYGHLAIVPNMRVLVILCITAGAFLPVGIPVMMPYGCGEIVT